MQCALCVRANRLDFSDSPADGVPWMTTAVSTTQSPGHAADPAQTLWYRSPRVLTGAAMIAVVFVGLFFRWFLIQNQHSWKEPQDWGHAYLIPFIAGYLIWQRRAALSRVRPEIFWPGLAPFLLGVMSYFFAVVSLRNPMTQGISILLCLFGVVLLLLGPRVMRYLFLPIVFLAFAITVSDQIMLKLTFKLQLLASEGSWVMLSLIGSPLEWFTVDLEGNTLTIVHEGKNIPLNVAEACSGMRMVVAFFALAVSVAVLACKSWWQRILLLLLAGPVAVFMNMVRVTVLGLASLGDADLAAGEAHTLIGTILLIPSLLLFMAIVWALNKVIREPAGGDA
ncbi:MAG: hypothetical protein DHS20C14_03160 [Phycisphaeraceae bacterium]|nr:MAG: hypothetical protein DHS20C14_03160 [Phycisphaeraceae bacterium]